MPSRWPGLYPSLFTAIGRSETNMSKEGVERTVSQSVDEDDPEQVGSTRDEIHAELALLREQNATLRDSYVQAKQTQYRRTALGLAGLGSLAGASGLILPDVRELLFVLGAIGLFGGLLTYYLTPERFVAADVSNALYSAMADDREAILDELGLADERVYTPVGERNSRVRLFVPQSAEYEIPSDDELDSFHVVPESPGERGVAFRPTGEPLYQSFEDTVTGSVAETPAELVPQLTDALVEQFDLVTETSVDLDANNGRLTIGVDDAVYGSVTRLDHPVASVLAVGLARQLGQPVTVETRASADERMAVQVTCRW
ncbi:hypothetical protein HZS55_06060 [Halosimplex rubrum]|uniref:DUF7982 domain-containing protein n=1 Tax=Halosimplex rubrum TaxID=869889 RepID=A0A7D5TKS7_9EURY|nr:hypothetical protein [Halosimplex rubrum]QLH76892.1 hypothetical protein HZS55_06060 [Halosimplex rubrum]